MKILLISCIIALGIIGIAHATTITEIERLNRDMALVTIQRPESPVRAEFEAYGIASWYNYSLNGIEWSKTHRTAASRTFPRYSTVKVTNQTNGKSVEVFINDYVENPDVEIDLSSYAFKKLAPLSLGLINVKIELIK